MTGFPINPPREPIAGRDGIVTSSWYRYFAQIQSAVGTSASATWQDGFVLVPGPLAGISSNDIEGGGSAIPVGVVSIASDYTVRSNDCLVRADATSFSLSVLLPSAATCPGRVVRVKKTDSSANTVSLVAQAGNQIDGAGSATLTLQYDSLALLSIGTGWDVI